MAKPTGEGPVSRISGDFRRWIDCVSGTRRCARPERACGRDACRRARGPILRRPEKGKGYLYAAFSIFHSDRSRRALGNKHCLGERPRCSGYGRGRRWSNGKLRERHGLGVESQWRRLSSRQIGTGKPISQDRRTSRWRNGPRFRSSWQVGGNCLSFTERALPFNFNETPPGHVREKRLGSYQMAQTSC
jgi:hypothetical protein